MPRKKTPFPPSAEQTVRAIFQEELQKHVTAEAERRRQERWALTKKVFAWAATIAGSVLATVLGALLLRLLLGK